MSMAKDWRRNLFDWLTRRWQFIIADAADNSVSFSQALFSLISPLLQDRAEVLVFRDRAGRYGFTINPDREANKAIEGKQLPGIQLNPVANSVGFDCQPTTVSRIFYDYGVPVASCVCMPVRRRIFNGVECYMIMRPTAKEMARARKVDRTALMCEVKDSSLDLDSVLKPCAQS